MSTRDSKTPLRHSTLLSLTLENFQSLRDRVTIPLQGITLLFGPNSAGKSSVVDAFELLRLFWRFEESDSAVLDSLLRRWVHHRGQDGQQAATASFEIEFTLPNPDSYCYTLLRNALSRFPYVDSMIYNVPDQPLRARLMFSVGTYGRSGHWSPARISVALADRAVWCWQTSLDPEFDEKAWGNSDFDSHLWIDFGHPIFEGCFDGWSMPNAKFRHANDGEKVVRWIYGHAGFGFFDFHNFALDEVRDQEAILALAIQGASEFLVRGLGALLGDVLEFAQIKADRRIPTAKELVFVFESSIARDRQLIQTVESWRQDHETRLSPKQQKHANPVDTLLAARLSNGNAHASFYRMLARSLADARHRSLALSCQALDDAARHLITESRRGTGETLGDAVNRALRDSLFLDNGYQVIVEVRQLVAVEQIVRPQPDIAGMLEASLLVCMRLTDSKGRRVDIEDVGSGIGFVIPVLIGLNASALSVVEQPELHLHPALQSALGDVVLDAFHQRHQTIIETHSEHMLLRLLRRVRETMKGLHQRTTSALHPEDLTVLYFDPQTDGSTRVRHLRVAADGEFIDRWPRGFFIERAQDLFDE